MTDPHVAGSRPDRPSLADAPPPTTGDADVDRILSDFAAAVQPREDVGPSAVGDDGDDTERHVEAATRAHRGLQDRLSAPRG